MSEASPTNSSCSPFDSKDYAHVAIASALSAFLSLLACSFVIFIMVLFKKWKFLSQKLILYLAIAALLTSVTTILHRVDYENQRTTFYTTFCAFSGFLDQLSGWMLLNAITSIMVYLFLEVVLKKRTKKYEVAYFLYIFVLPFSFNWIMFIKSSYGRAGAWCWIRSEERDTCESFPFGKNAIFLSFYLPLYINFFLFVIFYILILITLNRRNRQWTTANPTKEIRKQQKYAKLNYAPLLSYPFIFYGLWLFPFINRIQGRIDPNHPVLALWYLSAISYPLQGGIIAIAYSLDPRTRKRLRSGEVCTALRRCCSRKAAIEEYTVEEVVEEENSTSNFETEYKKDLLTV